MTVRLRLFSLSFLSLSLSLFLPTSFSPLAKPRNDIWCERPWSALPLTRSHSHTLSLPLPTTCTLVLASDQIRLV
ncbi:MAG: hypothetical protein J3Q66DRAFT_328067 [Benniella sp.]|nr:MAG: hypothetical protein J3Q66DRAFT_328067 [Benniella sp.]